MNPDTPYSDGEKKSGPTDDEPSSAMTTMAPSDRKTNVLMVLVILVIGVANILWAERLTVRGGFGWDGVNYAAWTRNFYQSVFVNRIPEYFVKRILPSGIVHYGRRLAIEPFFSRAKANAILSNNHNILLSFDLYNLALLLVAAWTWGLIANELKLGKRGRWFGLCFLFVNYAILKNNVYHSVLTDTSAFTLGILMFYFFLANKPIALLTTIFLGGFTWPTIPHMGALLFVFPYQKETVPDLKSGAGRFVRLLPLAAAVTICSLILFFFFKLAPNIPQKILEYGLVLRIDLPLLYLSLAAVIVYLFFGLRHAFSDRRLFDARGIFKAIRWYRVLVVAMTFVLLHLIVHRLASGVQPGWSGARVFLEYTLLSSLTEPALFLVAHTVYFGPVVLLLLFYWKPFCESILRYGIGLRLFVIANVLLSIGPQSRYQINAITVFIVLLVRLLDGLVLTKRNFVAWALLSVVYSKVWYTFNTALQQDDGTMERLLQFPLQHYFMNSGPWMSREMYLIQGSVVLATAIALYFIVARKSASSGIFPKPEVKAGYREETQES